MALFIGVIPFEEVVFSWGFDFRHTRIDLASSADTNQGYALDP
jgi:hypothetical protein